MTPEPASLKRRLASLVYEAMILVSLWIVAGFPFVALIQALEPQLARHLSQVYLFVVTGFYFVWFWLHGGQTLPMKTWRIRVEAETGAALTPRQAWLRYVLAVFSLACLGLGFLWALFDPERRFLHDRLAHSRIVYLGKI